MKNFVLEIQLGLSFLAGVAAAQILDFKWALALGFLGLASVVCAKIGVFAMGRLFLMEEPETANLPKVCTGSEMDPPEQFTQSPDSTLALLESLPDNVIPLNKSIKLS